MTAVDRNRTIWQRIQGHCEPVFGRVVADQIATLLLGPVVAERQDASERAGSLMPLHVLREVRVMGLDDRGRADLAPLNCGCAAVSVGELQRALGGSHGSPSFVSAEST